MTILLPDTVKPEVASPQFKDWGGPQTPILGGEVLWISRLGSRFSVSFTMPRLKPDCAKQFIAAQLASRTLNDRVSMKWPQVAPSATFGANPLVDGPYSGSAIGLKGLTPGRTIPVGTMLSILHGGRRYLHMVRTAVTANGSGQAAVVNIAPMLRVTLANNDDVEMDNPRIEGMIDGSIGWSLDWLISAQFSFSITETA